MKVSRRKLAQILTAGAVTAAAQAPPQPAPEGRRQLRGDALAISRVPLAMSVEPAFRFKA
jgi:hypothetical protein